MNAEPTAVMWNPQSAGTYARLKDTLGQPLRATPDLADLVWLDGSALKADETQGTGTAQSSIYVGDWSRMIMGIRVDLTIDVLKERYAEFVQIGFLSYFRFSIRTSHAESAFYRLTGNEHHVSNCRRVI